MKILHLEKSCYSNSSLKKLEQLGDIEFKDFDSQSELNQHLAKNKYEVIFTRLGFYLGGEELKNQTSLKCILSPTTGLNHIDLEYTSKQQIEVLSLKNEFEFLSQIKSTAEHTWMLLLALIRNLIPATSDVNEGAWNRIPFLADELNTKSLGIIGLGRLGKILLRYAEAFDMKIRCFDINDDVFDNQYKAYKSDLEELLEHSDFVILQVDYRPENYEFFNSDKFLKMKHGAYFINTSRGEIVEEKALIKALESGKLKGAALDVLHGDSAWKSYSEESHLLSYAKSQSNLLITPHMGGYGKISIELTRDFITEKFIKSIN